MAVNQPQLSKKTRSSTGGKGFAAAIHLLSALMLLLFIMPLIALIWRAVVLTSGGANFGYADLLTSLSISLITTVVSMLVIVLFGTPLAYLLSRTTNRGIKFLGILVELPIVMPPVVAGLALLSAFGRSGLLGAAFSFLGIQLPFTPAAVVIAQVFVSSPFYIRAAQSSFNSLPPELEEAARIDGASAGVTFRQIMLPMSSPAMISGLLLSWARALGEFGATILFAGNLAGSTQTMSLLVFTALERDLGATYTTALILLGLAAVLLGGMRILARLDRGEHPQVTS
ncbi:MAG: ABC transporter permease [Chloroflexota bacterium]